MLTTVFAVTGDTQQEIDDNCLAISLNVKLIRLFDPKRHVSLVVRDMQDIAHLKIRDFDKVYQNKTDNNDIAFVANTLLRIDCEQILYTSPRVFSLSPLSRAFERNMPDGVFLPAETQDFRGCALDVGNTWQTQQIFSKHDWPVVMPRLLLSNNDEKSREFLLALERFALHWKDISSELSDGAMTEMAWDNLVSFTCQTHAANYRTAHCLDFRTFANRDFAMDKNWVNKSWHQWLDTWWVTKDAEYLRVENFRQQGFVELTNDCLDDISAWIKRIEHGRH